MEVIKNKTQYLAALERFEEIFQAKPGTKENNEANMLALAIEEYEKRFYIIGTPHPVTQ
jgi:HTH-type transcriptional regulator / antitoxin HigA